MRPKTEVVREPIVIKMALNGLARSTGGAAGAALFGDVVFAFGPTVEAFHRAFLAASPGAAAGALVASRMPSLALWKV